MSAPQDELRQIEAAIAALEAQRPVLGDAVVEVAIAPLREKLTALKRAQTLIDERKRVTVLFADVSGYTAMSERLDPEDVADIMNLLFQRLEAQIVQFGGTVDKYSGDAVMALFGAPKALENHEEMAVRAALAIQREVAAYSEELQHTHGLELKMRVGINTGDVLAGMIGGPSARHYTVMGDTVNLAARLEQACPVGRIMVSAATVRRLHTIFEFEPPRQITVKGKSEPVTVYVVVGERAERGRVRGLEGFTAPMVGRDRELAELRDALTTALWNELSGALWPLWATPASAKLACGGSSWPG
ncbi:MAG: adenylate/guanylate cyclase domain-containing protein [Ardenticatenia bacterium]|nr:adenylate/guanylate cyclase domain-containing protein [Ardenticatenia bacterium]